MRVVALFGGKPSSVNECPRPHSIFDRAARCQSSVEPSATFADTTPQSPESRQR
ncbi:MAG: hypothetical protein M3439_04755 [Chloroflexota bacterium]|nr:hypothetical protein [Chloroflexota bacterium]